MVKKSNLPLALLVVLSEEPLMFAYSVEESLNLNLIFEAAPPISKLFEPLSNKILTSPVASSTICKCDKGVARLLPPRPKYPKSFNARTCFT